MCYLEQNDHELITKNDNDSTVEIIHNEIKLTRALDHKNNFKVLKL